MKIEKNLFIVHSITCTIGSFLAFALFDVVIQRLTKVFPGYPDLISLTPGTPPSYIINIHQMGSLSVLVVTVIFIVLSALFTFVRKTDKSAMIISILATLNLIYLFVVFFCHVRSLLGIRL